MERAGAGACGARRLCDAGRAGADAMGPPTGRGSPRRGALRSSAGRRGGRAHAPRPRVSCEPICSLLRAWWFSRACASVLTAQNSTPCGVGGQAGGGGVAQRAARGPHAVEGGGGGRAAGGAAPHRQAAGDHAVDGVAAAAAAADDLDAGVACRGGWAGSRQGGAWGERLHGAPPGPAGSPHTHRPAGHSRRSRQGPRWLRSPGAAAGAPAGRQLGRCGAAQRWRSMRPGAAAGGGPRRGGQTLAGPALSGN